MVQNGQHTLVSLRLGSAALSNFGSFSFIKKARYGKPPLSVEDQLKLLESRGMRIADPMFAVRALSTVSYYRLSACSYPFRSRPDDCRFRDGTTFERVWRYYRFDRRLKNVVLDGIERMEIATRTKIVNRFAGLYGPFGYRETANFAAPIDNIRFSKTLTLIEEETVRSSEEFVAHFRKTYDTSDGMPLWMAAEVMTFGNMLTFFRMLKMKDSYAIAVAEAGESAYLCGESVLALLNLAPTNPRYVNIAAPNWIRRQLDEGYRMHQGRKGYVPMIHEGMPIQKPLDAIRDCIGKLMSERPEEATRAACEHGYLY